MEGERVSCQIIRGLQAQLELSAPSRIPLFRHAEKIVHGQVAHLNDRK